MSIIYSVYARVSSEAQASADKVSIPEQLRICHEYATKQGWVRAAHSEYTDSISGEEYEGRPAFIQMLQDAKAKAFDVLLIQIGDRISRRVWITSKVFHDLTQAGVQICDVSKTTPVMPPAEFRKHTKADSGRLIENTFTALMAEIDQTQRVGRSVAGKLGAVERGKYIWAKPPFGYKFEIRQTSTTGKVERIPVPDPATYHLLEELPVLILDKGLGDRAIAKLWNNQGYRTTLGNTWSNATIMTLRTNIFYAGIQRYGNKRLIKNSTGKKSLIKNQDETNIILAPHSFEHPWSLEIFERMQQAKAENYKAPGKVSSLHSPLVGLLRCGYCGASMRYRQGQTRMKPVNGKPYLVEEPDAFKCQRQSLTGMGCEANRWQVAVVWQEIIYFLDALAATQGHETYNPSNGVATQLTSLSRQIEAVKMELGEGLERRRRRTNEAYQGEVIELDEYRKQRAELDERRNQLQSQLAALQTELDRAENEAGRAIRVSSALENWQELRLEIAEYGDQHRDWPTELVHDLRSKVLKPLFRSIKLGEDKANPKWGKWKRKENLIVKFELF